MAQFYYNLSDKSDQDSSTTATNIFILLKIFLKNKMMYTYLTTM